MYKPYIDIRYLKNNLTLENHRKFSVSQIKYPLGGSSKKGSHVQFLLIVAMVLPL